MSIDVTKATGVIPTLKPPVGSPTPPTATQESQPQTEAAPNPNQEKLDLTPLKGSAHPPVVDLVETPTPDVKAASKAQFKADFGLDDKHSLRPNDARLVAKLKEYANQIDKNPDMKHQIGRNPRGMDFLWTLEQAQTGKALSRDDIQSLQLFLIKDTKYGAELSYPGGDEGHDGKYGFRTHGALDRFLKNFQPSDLVPDAYYDRLDQEGVKYARLP